MQIFARSYRRPRSVTCWMISKPAQPKPLTRYQTPSAACFNQQKAPHRGALLYRQTSPFLTMLQHCHFRRYSILRHPRPAHQQGVGFNNAERFALAKAGCFAAGRMFVRRDRDAMLMVFCIVGIVPSCIFLVIRSVGGVLRYPPVPRPLPCAGAFRYPMSSAPAAPARWFRRSRQSERRASWPAEA